MTFRNQSCGLYHWRMYDRSDRLDHVQGRTDTDLPQEEVIVAPKDTEVADEPTRAAKSTALGLKNVQVKKRPRSPRKALPSPARRRKVLKVKAKTETETGPVCKDLLQEQDGRASESQLGFNQGEECRGEESSYGCVRDPIRELSANCQVFFSPCDGEKRDSRAIRSWRRTSSSAITQTGFSHYPTAGGDVTSVARLDTLLRTAPREDPQDEFDFKYNRV